MTTSAQSIIREAATTLQDPDGVRWPAGDLVTYLNRGQRDIQSARPDSTAYIAPLTLVSGYRQTIPDVAASLIDIATNLSGEMITKTDLVILDASEPNWRKRTQARLVRHFMHDLRFPRSFQVFPPVVAGTVIEAELSAYPTDVPAPSGDGKLVTQVTGSISLSDQFSTPLLCMVLHYAYAKDAEFGGNAAMSAAYLQRAQSILGVELQSGATVAPKS